MASAALMPAASPMPTVWQERIAGNANTDGDSRTHVLSVDVSIQAATKYIVGHSDAMMGLISCRDRAHFEIAKTAWLDQHAFFDEPLSTGATDADGYLYVEHTGLDADGKEFRLSDYRGQVVVIDFWADWCPHCVAMYPMERQLVQRHAGKPFALLGVNCDQRPRLQRVLESKAVTWRNWTDGPQGAISRQWRVEGFPTVYVIDHEGVIRYKNVRGPELERAVDTLLSKVPSSIP